MVPFVPERSSMGSLSPINVSFGQMDNDENVPKMSLLATFARNCEK
jgi:hypothetical protein